MDVTQANASLSGVNFMPSSPPPEEQGIKPWPKDLEFDFIKYLESDESTNRSVLTSTKRNTIRQHLQNPTKAPLVGLTAEQRQAFNNAKHDALQHYELQDNQVYPKAGIAHSV
jgi:hypothetical protein